MPPTSFGRGHKKYSFLFISSFKKIVFLAVDFFLWKVHHRLDRFLKTSEYTAIYPSL